MEQGKLMCVCVYVVVWCWALTEQRLDDHTVQSGVAVGTPLGTHAVHPHLVGVQIGHSKVHCDRERQAHYYCNRSIHTLNHTTPLKEIHSVRMDARSASA